MTRNDDDNGAAVNAVSADELNLVGVASYVRPAQRHRRNAFDKVLKGARLHP